MSIFLSLSGAYSERNIAAPIPNVKATTAAINATRNVPPIRGRTPKCAGLNKGVHLVPVKNSQGETFSKNIKLWLNNTIIMPNVVVTEIIAVNLRILATIFSSRCCLFLFRAAIF